MQVPMLDLKRIHDTQKQEIDEAIKRVLEKSSFILGEEVERFEEEFARFLGTKYAIGVGNGTDAITLSLLATGVKPGNEVITTSLSAFPTAEAILRAGAKPVYADICPATYNLDPKKIEQAITENTRAIIPVHLYGLPADMGPIMALAKKHELAVIEDCAQAHGAKYSGKYVGTLGLTGCFSFFPSKNLGGMGDGGMVVTDDKDVAALIRMLRNHGQGQRFEHVAIGYNSRLDGIQAAILRVKLTALRAHNKMRKDIGLCYDQAFAGTSFLVQRIPSYAKHSRHLYVLRVTGQRDELRTHLAKQGVQTNIHYPTPLHKQPAYPTAQNLPMVEEITKQIFSIPLFPFMREEEVHHAIGTIKEWAA